MARVMVREAARSCSDAAGLAAAVSRHIPEDAKRQQFIDSARSGSRVTSVPVPTHPQSTAIATTPLAQERASADPLTDALRAQVLQIVTRKMGPIARVMVKRAADAANGSQARFIQLLLEALPEADRWVVQGEVDKLG